MAVSSKRVLQEVRNNRVISVSNNSSLLLLMINICSYLLFIALASCHLFDKTPNKCGVFVGESFGSEHAINGTSDIQQNGSNGRFMILLNEDVRFLSFWKYDRYNSYPWAVTDVRQIDTKWRIQDVDWPVLVSYPVVHRSARYFRKDINLPKVDYHYIISVKLITKSGFYIYFDGFLVFSWGIIPSRIPNPMAESNYFSRDNVFTSFAVFSSSFPIEGLTLRVGIEIHHCSGEIQYVDQSEISIELYEVMKTPTSSLDGRCVIYPIGKDGSILFDNDDTTYLEIDCSSSCSVIWTWYEESQLPINSYSISVRSTNSSLNPHTWTLYGSRNTIDWIILDSRSGIEWLDHRNQSFSFNNTQPITSLKLFISSHSHQRIICISELSWRINAVTEEQIHLHYSQSSISLFTDVPVENIYPISYGFIYFSIICDNDTFPLGVHMDPSNGFLYGMSSSIYSKHQCIITAIQQSTNRVVSCHVTLSVSNCTTPTSSILRLSRSSSLYASSIRMASMNTIYGFQGPILDICLTKSVDDIVVTSDTSKSFNFPIIFTMSFINNHEPNEYEQYLVDYVTSYYIIYAPFWIQMNPTLFTTFAAIPSDWFNLSYDTHDWKLYSHDRSFYADTEMVFFRSSFILHSIPIEMNNWRLNLKLRGGFIIYINGILVIQSNHQSTITNGTRSFVNSIIYEWNSIIGPLSHLHIGTNQIAIVIIEQTLKHSSIHFQYSFYLNSITSSSSSQTHHIQSPSSLHQIYYAMDGNPNTSYKTQFLPTTNHITLFYPTNRYPLFNHYCILPGPNYRYDPRSWRVYGGKSTYKEVLLDEIVNVHWYNRESLCFLFPIRIQYFRYFSFVFTQSNNIAIPIEILEISEIYLYYRNYTNTIIPSLSVTPTSIRYISIFPFIPLIYSTQLFTNFTITPALPTGLSFHPYTGQIIGTTIISQPFIQYTIEATSYVGLHSTTRISIEISQCPIYHIPLEIQYFPSLNCSNSTITLYHIHTQKVIDSFILICGQVLHRYYCSLQTDYQITIEQPYDCVLSTLDSIIVRIMDNTTISSWIPTFIDNIFSGSFSLFIPLESRVWLWSYSFDKIVPENWHSEIQKDWPIAMALTIPSAPSITVYYVTQFTIESLTDFSTVNIRFYSPHGIAMYLNGVLIRSLCLPNTIITSSTFSECIVTHNSYHNFVFIVALLPLYIGTNIFAIEHHRKNPLFDFSQFDTYIRFIRSQTNIAMNGKILCNPHCDIDSSLLYNRIIKVIITVQRSSSNQSLSWIYDPGMDDILTQYSLMIQSNVTDIIPLDWKVICKLSYGIHKPYSIIQSESIRFHTNQEITFHTVSDREYPVYEWIMNLTELFIVNPTLSLCNLSLTLKLFSSPIHSYCRPLDGFHATSNGMIAYKECPNYYKGELSRKCTNGIFEPINHQCSLLEPNGITYPDYHLVLLTNIMIDPFVPVIEGADYHVYTYDRLPKGLYMNTTNGIIHGSIFDMFSSYIITVTVENAAGIKSTQILLISEEGTIVYYPVEMSLLAIGISILICGCIHIVLFLTRKKDVRTRMPRVNEYARVTNTKAKKIIYIEL